MEQVGYGEAIMDVGDVDDEVVVVVVVVEAGAVWGW